MAGISWDDKLTANIKRVPPAMDKAVFAATEFHATRAQAYMRQNAPWRDRTGNARSGLRATPFHVPFVKHGITLSHSVPYGIWLELRWSGRYAIIRPTMEAEGPQLMRTIKDLFGWK